MTPDRRSPPPPPPPKGIGGIGLPPSAQRDLAIARLADELRDLSVVLRRRIERFK